VSERLSIVQVSPTVSGGGAASVALALHEDYLRRGHESQLLVGPSSERSSDVIVLRNGEGVWAVHDRLRHASRPRAARLVRVVAAPTTVVDAVLGREDFRFPGTRLVDRKIVGADVLQLHNLHGAFFDLRALPRLAARVPVVLSPHDAWLTTGHCAHTLGCERWRTGCGRCPHLRVYPALLRDGTAGNWLRKKDIYARAPLRLVVPCRWLADVVADSMLAPAIIELRVIPHGVDLEIFHPGDRQHERIKLGLSPTAAVLAFAAQGVRANEFKDYPTFSEALKLLGASSGPPVVAIALGASRKATTQLGRVEIRHLGRVPPSVVGSWFRAADLYVHASRAETFPLAILEALACGLPVVASAVGGVPEQIGANTGLLVPPGDARILFEALSALLDDPDRRREMGLAAAKDAARRFGRERQADEYVGWFRELARNRARSR
jgi:glycosyltransferase involved in cell wall biosynthesis